MYGVDFDFEYIAPQEKDIYIDLIRRAAQRLNAEGYLVSVALAAKTSADQAGLLYEGHDYAAVGQSANLVLLMTYEWGYAGSEPMAVAPIPQIRQVLDYGSEHVALFIAVNLPYAPRILRYGILRKISQRKAWQISGVKEHHALQKAGPVVPCP